ncbi:MAG: hypothetical protein JWP91_4291 [Fibrobacteres bacterium]|nr:hypothetical protein [Fibrobacterota bacterium]
MDFGKLKDVRDIDFTLPPDDPATASVLAKASAASPATQAGTSATDRTGFNPLRVHIGCPVWQDEDLARKLCPKGTAKARRLACYSRQFNALELNSTGYGLDQGRIRHWAGETPPGFRFCPKVPRDVTHVPNLDGVWDLYDSHCEAAEAFGSRLGFFLMQFPEAFGPSRFAELERFLQAKASRLPLAVEVRHPAWFLNEKWKHRLFDLMEAHGVASVLTDTAGHREVLHQRLTTRSAFIRFNGVAVGAGDFRRLDEWAARIRSWMDQGLDDLYLFAHLDPVGDSAELAAHFIRSLKAATGLDLAEPRIRNEAEDEEPSLAL